MELVMELTYDYDYRLRSQLETLRLVEELNNIHKYTGLQLHVLTYNVHLSFRDVGQNHHAYFMDTVLRVCPKLQELDTSGLSLKCCKQNDQHKTLQKIYFGENTEFQDGFFKSLSSRLPNLSYMKLRIERSTDHMEVHDISMPYTKFTQLTMNLKNRTYFGKSPKEEGVAIKITTNDNGVSVTRFYHCVSQEESKIYRLQLVHECEDNMLDYTVNTASLVAYCVTSHITCLSIKTFILKTDYNKYSLQI